MGEIRVEGNRGRDGPVKKWIGVIGKYMKARGVDEDMVRNMKGGRKEYV